MLVFSFAFAIEFESAVDPLLLLLPSFELLVLPVLVLSVLAVTAVVFLFEIESLTTVGGCY